MSENEKKENEKKGKRHYPTSDAKAEAIVSLLRSHYPKTLKTKEIVERLGFTPGSVNHQLRRLADRAEVASINQPGVRGFLWAWIGPAEDQKRFFRWAWRGEEEAEAEAEEETEKEDTTAPPPGFRAFQARMESFRPAENALAENALDNFRQELAQQEEQYRTDLAYLRDLRAEIKATQRRVDRRRGGLDMARKFLALAEGDHE